MTLKTTQTLGNIDAQQALAYLAGVLNIPQSRVLESLLCSAPAPALAELVAGGRTLTGVRLVALDIPAQLAVMDAIAAGVNSLSGRLQDAVREAVQAELQEAINGQEI